jgi:hypothetical protein
MSLDATASLFVMLGQTADKTIAKIDDVVPKDSLLISKDVDLALLAPDTVRKAVEASEAYKLFFFFESYLRELSLLRVKQRRTHCEQMSSELPPKADIAQCSRHVSKVPPPDSCAQRPSHRE